MNKRLPLKRKSEIAALCDVEFYAESKFCVKKNFLTTVNGKKMTSKWRASLPVSGKMFFKTSFAGAHSGKWFRMYL